MLTDIDRLRAHAQEVARVARGRLAAARLLNKHGFSAEADFLTRNACASEVPVRRPKEGSNHVVLCS